ncbi:MAG: hypothetical protein WCV79_00930 [Candidatus Paceibacterota bacterium]|jgi:hypothetical protein
MEPQSGIKTWQWVVTVIVIIALIVIGILVFGNKKAAPSTPDTTATPTAAVGTTNSIVLSDQFPGNVVYLSSVQAAQPVWVAIHKDNNGQPGAIIGYAQFDKGISPGKITLSESTIDGMTYYAMLHSDDGDTTFDATKDVPLTDASGNIIMRLFKASASANAQIKG